MPYLQLEGHHIIKSSECGFKRLQSIHVFSAGSSIHSWPAVKICLFREDWNCSKLTYPLLTQHVKTWMVSLQASDSSSWLLLGELDYSSMKIKSWWCACPPRAHATLWSLAQSTPLLIRTSLSKRPWYLQSLKGLLTPQNCPRLRLESTVMS